MLLAIPEFPMLTAGFRALLDAQPDMAVTGVSAGPAALLDEIATTHPDVVVTECLPFDAVGRSTFEAIASIRTGAPGTKVIALDCRGAVEQFTLALKAGAHGFLTRETSESDVVAAVRSVAAGHTYVSPSIVTRMVDQYVRRAPDAAGEDPFDSLSERERQVLLLASVGHTTRDIARILHLSEQRAHYLRARTMEKLGLHDRVELLRYTVRRGLLNAANL